MTSAPTFLGYIGQAPIDPLEALHNQHRPGVSLPAYVRCEARRSPELPSLRRCKALVCPRCNRDRIKARFRDMHGFVAEACEAGVGMRFLTLTCPHEAGAPLRLCIQAVQGAWAATRRGSPYARLKRAGLLGVVNFLDFTHGQNGWHAHFHCLVVTRTKAVAAKCGAGLVERYCRYLARRGLLVTAMTADERHVYSPLRLAGYFARSWRLLTKDGSDTPFALLHRGLSGCSKSAALFFELTDAIARRRCLTISPQLRRAVMQA